jgi:hypothetical protein
MMSLLTMVFAGDLVDAEGIVAEQFILADKSGVWQYYCACLGQRLFQTRVLSGYCLATYTTCRTKEVSFFLFGGEQFMLASKSGTCERRAGAKIITE